MSSRQPPSPLEWHPAYRDRTWLLDWLEGRHGLTNHQIVLPIKPAPTIASYLDNPDGLGNGTVILTRHWAMGWAPYVGRPFVYMWFVAFDNLGRSIAGESRIVYTDGAPDG